MTKDEMKNRISMALKDPILQQGFEIICKNLADLEKENAELKKSVNNWLKYEKETQYHKSIIKDLKKENAELKKEVLEVRQHLDLTEREWGKDTTKLIHYKTQLNKAKDILGRLMENQPTPSSMYEEIDLVGWREVNKEAEQFLKGEEK